MPELPEVHTTATMLNSLIKGLRIVSTWTDYKSPSHAGKDDIKNPKFFADFAKKVSDTTFTKIYRRGKNVLLELDNNQTILIHMKMTGHILYGTYRKIRSTKSEIRNKTKSKERWKSAEAGPLGDFRNQFLHLVFTLSDGKHLALSDMRKFAKVTLISTSEIATSSHLESIGPEPLEKSFNLARFTERLLCKPTGKIKQVLMNPEVVAGIGNIYSDEMLYLAGIHPLSTVKKVPQKSLEKLFDAMKLVLEKGIDFGGDSTSDYRNPLGEFGKFHHHHSAYRKTGQPCEKKNCGGTIRKIKLGGRSAHFCDRHQIQY
ncbi:MAG: bifunctional DNA-formamidopyrimidine glycosylase/DNA-(apurinic or apyrimidinic site) lyase [Patescibacteria group bacterium]